MKNPADNLKRACEAISQGAKETAGAILQTELPFEPVAKEQRKYTATEATQVFLRDGFVDRYGGDRLIYPPVLRALSLALPSVFPFHPNWRADQCHIAYWILSPTVDHIVPVARGGLDSPENWVTTSMFRNSAKSNWLLEEIGWSLQPKGDLSDWDGMFAWFLEYANANPSILQNGLIRRWHRAALIARENLERTREAKS